MSANMLKAGSKRRRTKAEIQADRDTEIVKRQNIQDRLDTIPLYVERVSILERENEESKAATNLLQQFIDAGLVQQTGDNAFVVHGSHGDREFKAGQQ